MSQTPTPPKKTPPETPPRQVPKFEISHEEIARVVAAFYAQVRAHPGLAPVFAAHVADWPAHEAKVAQFWASSILGTRGYRGNPMRAHSEAGNVRPGMFEPWLELFDATLARELPPETAQSWSDLAHHIGRSMRAGVSGKLRHGQVPILR